MREVLDYFTEREAEFGRHLTIARLLEARVDETAGEFASQVEIRHINTLKSGLLIHLYNIVEAVTTRTMQIVGQAVVAEKPKLWTDAVLKEWLRATIWDGEERFGERVFERLAGVSAALVSGNSPDAFMPKGTPGSWDDTAIKTIAARFGCPLTLTAAIKRAAYEPVYLNEMTAMKYLASRRNAIAHGAATFEEGASGQTLDDIANLAERILPYLKAVTESYEAFLASKSFLVAQGQAA